MRSLAGSGAVELVTGFRIKALRLADDGRSVTVVGDGPVGPTGLGAVVAATEYRPDPAVLAELQLDLDAGLEAPRALAPLVDPQLHSCCTVPPHGHENWRIPSPASTRSG